MKKSPYLNIKRIEFMVTYRCTEKCIHCSVGDKSNCSEGFDRVKIAEATEAIEWLAQNFSISSVMTFGGEPLLYPDVVCAIHRTARRCAVPTRQLITNGYFSKNEDRIRQVAQLLGDSGVNQLLLSVDAFHQQTISVEVVYRFAECVKQAGLSEIQLQPAWLVRKGHENPYNEKTNDILAKFCDLDISISDGNDIFMAGNAVKHLAEFYAPPNLNFADTCGSTPYTEPLTDITSLSIVPNGDVLVCDFVIGNIYRENMENIISRYNPYENIYMNAILSGGAPALIKAAEANSIAVNCSACYSICDLCRQINSQTK